METIKLISECEEELKEKFNEINDICLYNSEKVINELGEDVSSYFHKGASIAIEKALDNDVKLAIVKEKSPSCGYRKIYNGKFDGTKIDGSGIFTRLLIEKGIKILTEEDFE